MYTKQLKAKHSYLSNTSMIRICLLFFYLYCFKINLQSMKGITNFISLNLLSHMHLISHILRPLSLYELKPENQSTKMLHWVFYKTDHPFVFLALWWQKNEQNLKNSLHFFTFASWFKNELYNIYIIFAVHAKTTLLPLLANTIICHLNQNLNCMIMELLFYLSLKVWFLMVSLLL